MAAMELGPFLRSRRESVTPEEVGLSRGPRRRTPGLRRAELSTLAGVSVEYLTRLEQGRDRHPSAQVLAAIAEALRFGPDDLAHLRRLAAISGGEELCPTAPPSRSVRPTVQVLLDRLEPSPAVVLNGRTDLLAWTGAYERLTRPLGLLDGDAPNLLRWTFADPRARMTVPDWDVFADGVVGHLGPGGWTEDARGAFLAGLGEEGASALIDRMTVRPVVARRTGTTHFVHPEVGDLRLAFEVLQLPEADGQLLLVYLAADAATTAGLDRLTGRRPGGLRVVADP